MAKAQVLCLHGKRQDGEIFSQRLERLTRRLAPVADFTFVDAPFLLELEEGQSVPMRAWWRGDPRNARPAAARRALRLRLHLPLLLPLPLLSCSCSCSSSSLAPAPAPSTLLLLLLLPLLSCSCSCSPFLSCSSSASAAAAEG